MKIKKNVKYNYKKYLTNCYAIKLDGCSPPRTLNVDELSEKEAKDELCYLMDIISKLQNRNIEDGEIIKNAGF